MTETKSFRLGSPVCAKHKFWQKLQSLECQYLPRKRLCSSVFLLLRLFQLCSYVLHPPRACSKHKDSFSFTQLRMAALHNNLLCRSELLKTTYICYDAAPRVIPTPKGQPEPSLCYQHQKHVPHFLNIASEHSVRNIWKCIEASSAYVCQRTRTHPVWKQEERPSAFHRELVTVADSPCHFGYCMPSCAQLHSVLQSHLLAERITVLEKTKNKKNVIKTPNKPKHTKSQSFDL